MTQDSLENKREQLEELEKSEREAQRLAEALGGRGNNGDISPTSPVDAGAEIPDRDAGNPDDNPGATSQIPAHPGPTPARRRTRVPGMGFLNALSYTLHGMMDVDPETARRNSITKTRETISQVSPRVTKS
jgi:sorting nexin-41/42